MTTHRPDRSATASNALADRARAHFDRAQSGSRPMAAFLVAIDRLERIGDDTVRAALRDAVEGLVLGDPQSGEQHLSRSGDRLLVLRPGLPLAEASTAARRLIEDARKLRVSHGERKLRITLSVGVAHNHGRRELSFEALVGVAEESLGVAQGAGGNRWVHTELYDMLQRRVDGGAGEPKALELTEVPGAPVAEVEPETRDEVLVPARAATPVAVVGARPAPVPQGPRAGSAALVGEARRRVAAGGEDRVEVLERRIDKLVRALDLAESEIARMQSQRVEPGIASIYRTVQGLAPDEAFFELKRKMMLDIFEANRELQKIAN